ncbi:MAG: hypothetical protein ACRD0O_15865 [Acidimicrobiia bacterium]
MSPSPSGGEGPPADPVPSLDGVPLPPYAPMVPLAVEDTGPPVPPELDDLLPPPAARPPADPPVARAAKKATTKPHTETAETAMPAAPPWDYGPVPSPAPAPVATQPGTDAAEEVAAPAEVALPTVREATNRLSSANARNSLSALALTLIVGLAWNLVSARRRRAGWY